MQTLKRIQKLAFTTQLAIISFLLGTLLLIVSFILPKNENLLIIGLFYVFAAIFINGIAFVGLGLQLLTDKINRPEIANKMLILLINIPIAFVYFLIVIHSL
jgi:hypothetical protein